MAFKKNVDSVLKKLNKTIGELKELSDVKTDEIVFTNQKIENLKEKVLADKKERERADRVQEKLEELLS